jgi:hypothetical protein
MLAERDMLTGLTISADSSPLGVGGPDSGHSAPTATLKPRKIAAAAPAGRKVAVFIEGCPADLVNRCSRNRFT